MWYRDTLDDSDLPDLTLESSEERFERIKMYGQASYLLSFMEQQHYSNLLRLYLVS